MVSPSPARSSWRTRSKTWVLQLVKEVATKTNDVAGDGNLTTATVLAQALVREGLAGNVRRRRQPHLRCKKGIDKAVARRGRGHQGAGQGDRRQGQSEDRPGRGHLRLRDRKSIGEVLANAIDKVGKDGVVTVEESNTFGLELEFTEGMQFDKGYLSPYFVTDQERQETVLDEPYI